MASDSEDEAGQCAEMCARAQLSRAIPSRVADVFNKWWNRGTLLVGSFRFFQMVADEIESRKARP